jgi:hypothetical protein
VRFFPDSLNATDSTFEVHRERPSILVFANAADAERCLHAPSSASITFLPLLRFSLEKSDHVVHKRAFCQATPH